MARDQAERVDGGGRDDIESPQRYPGLDIDEDIRHQRREWTANRIAWAALALATIAGLLGLFGGPGALNNATAGEPGAAVRIEHHRFGRALSPETLRIFFTPAAPSADRRFSCWLSAEFANHIELKSILPEPAAMEAAADGVVLEFELAEPRAAGELAVTIHFIPQSAGRLRAAAGPTREQTVTFSQFIYP